jgi:deazaflavin-dependent oxidoreductase (nitroreductase family)
VTNRITRHIASWAPGFAIVNHVGRRSGRLYHTPVNVFPEGDRYIFALTYGRGDWVQNVLAAGHCTIATRRKTIELTDPELFTDPNREHVPPPARWILRLLHVEEFLAMTAASSSISTASSTSTPRSAKDSMSHESTAKRSTTGTLEAPPRFGAPKRA